eukprot:TRINITY_DN69798_c0_g1_i1.p1 TRINITY_DN69798_c0_g1~~TRINITY_DN69798_c0_g1_i1.p1  ORF type:complete len:352 (-),score=46.09 TRINITY_DN69798_c0_g1_i1:352-1377(-)
MARQTVPLLALPGQPGALRSTTSPGGGPASARSCGLPHVGGGIVRPYTVGAEPPIISSARRLMTTPKVGVMAAASALGPLPATWSGRSSVLSPRFENVGASTVKPTDKGRRPYNVGIARARNQLQCALTTQGDGTQLRRLDQALGVGGCRFDYGMRRHMDAAQAKANRLSTRSENRQKNIEILGLERVLGRKTRTTTRKAPAEASGVENDVLADEDAMARAATRIQAVHRGKLARKKVDVMVAERQQQGQEEDYDAANDSFDITLYNDADPNCAMRLIGGEPEGNVEVQDDFGNGIEVVEGTYSMFEDEEGCTTIEVVLADGEKFATVADLNMATYSGFTG